MRRIQIIDLDGCITDDRWRRQFIDPENPDPFLRFHEYHKSCHLDDIANRHEIVEPLFIILTARPTDYAPQTQMWLRNHYLTPFHIVYRNHYDYNPAVVVKERMLRGLFDVNTYNIHPEEIVLAIDDRDEVIEMYQQHNLNTKLVRIGKDQHVCP